MNSSRLISLDLLRGLAVLLMIQQHVVVWLWQEPWVNLYSLWKSHPLILSANALGGLAAPLFIMIAGIGSRFFIKKYKHSEIRLIKRGFGLIGLGYLLNGLVPSWFSWGSWYVLHLIGLGLILTPLLLKLSNRFLLVGCLITFLSTGLTRNLLSTPSILFSEWMSNPHLPGEVFRLALVEGHFPVFPWIIFFMTGLILGNWLLAKKNQKILSLGIGYLLLSGLTFLIHSLHLLSANPFLNSFFKISTQFYPLSIFLSFILLGSSILLIYYSIQIPSFKNSKISETLVVLGNTSLTWFILHIVLVRQGLIALQKFKTFELNQTLILLALILVIIMIANQIWKTSQFKWGLEWWYRRITG